MNTLPKEYLEVLEKYEWRVTGYTAEGQVELETWSPAGENLLLCVSLDHFWQDLTVEYLNFDVDEHVEMWLEAKQSGVKGVPTARKLVQDAEWIDEMPKTLSEAFEEVNIDIRKEEDDEQQPDTERVSTDHGGYSKAAE